MSDPAKIIICPFCDNRADEKHLFDIEWSAKNADSLISDSLEKPLLNIFKCKKCKLIYIKNPGDFNFKSFHDEKANSIFFKKKIKIQADFIRSLFEKGDLLQIKCGNGELLNQLKNEAIKVIGIDDREGLIPAKDKLINEIYKYDFQSFFHYENEFDAIVFFDSLSKTYDPEFDIDKAIKLIKDDGLIFVEEKIFSSKIDDFFGKYYCQYNDPDKIFYYNPSLIKKIFKQKGLNLIKWKKIYPVDYKFFINSFSILFKNKFKIKKSFFRYLLLLPVYFISPFFNLFFYFKNYFKYKVFGTTFLAVFSKTKNK